MRIHAIQTGTVAIKQRQVRGAGQRVGRRLNTLLDRVWTDPLPIYVWVIEHPEGIIVVDTGETARVTEPGYFPRWHPYYRLGVREWVRPEEEVVARDRFQVEAGAGLGLPRRHHLGRSDPVRRSGEGVDRAVQGGAPPR